MANWEPLRILLADSRSPVTLSWQELDELVGGMPTSATHHVAYWSGDRSQWAGFRAKATVGSSVTFTRAVDTRSSSNGHTTQTHVGADIILVSCAKRKGDEPAPAKDLYTSALFREARAYAERSGAPWYILSAKHGLMEVNDVIAPYDMRMQDQSAAYRREWGANVMERLHELVGPVEGMTIEIHAGADYVAPIRSLLVIRGATVVEPLAGLQQGRRLAWYCRDRSDAAPAAAPLSQNRNDEVDIVELAEALTNKHNRVTLSDFVASKDPRMDSPGLYSWWMDATGAAEVSHGLGLEVRPGLVYVGQAGAHHSEAQKASTNTLWKRIVKMHCGRRQEFSTLRRTLGSTLAEARGESGIDESALTSWMLVHLQIIALPVADAATLRAVETEILSRLDPPFNLHEVERTELRSRLMALRKKYHRGHPRHPQQLAEKSPPTAAAHYVDAPDPSIDELITLVSDTTRGMTPAEFIAAKTQDMDSPGINAWFVDQPGADELSLGLGLRLGPGLVYAGQAGAARADGQKSSNTLWLRVTTMHLGARRDLSTLRESLAALLTEAHDQPISEGDLSQWMHEHLRLIAVPVADSVTLRDVQGAVVQKLDPPLNLRGVTTTAARQRLAELRKKHRPS
ncbi:hypothetical protein IPV09_07865 [Tessaracoccus sp. SD287]|uniref:DUF6884 domain-containing protein n=1 Tax=Tessaracoccus sp. SD287 TaxID=2782008 RepID=UPI001A97BCAD|nr:DUF6884 domain-containing protein [Tessaracoccus sp. SD287]MBO1031252.1 hypothetical protein [Tessaracoccus sp. SD287]